MAAKTRVYELAKELQMENKALVDLIRELGIEIKTVSSSLTDEQVSLIKGRVQGTKSLVVEEQRIKSTVIRRRRKIIEVAPPETPAPEPEPTEAAPAGPEPAAPPVEKGAGRTSGPP
jgi:translation initiation factor IF-2